MEFQLEIGGFMGRKYQTQLREELELERGRLHRLEIQL
jgi:hypothetical protein